MRTRISKARAALNHGLRRAIPEDIQELSARGSDAGAAAARARDEMVVTKIEHSVVDDVPDEDCYRVYRLFEVDRRAAGVELIGVCRTLEEAVALAKKEKFAARVLDGLAMPRFYNYHQVKR